MKSMKNLTPLILLGSLFGSLQAGEISYELRGFRIATENIYNGANVIMSKDWNNNDTLRWDGSNLRFIYRKTYYYDANYCLNAHNPRKGSNVNLYMCNKYDSEQQWDWRPGGLIALENTNLCLNSYRTREGSNLNLYTCNANDPDQRFKTLKHLRIPLD